MTKPRAVVDTNVIVSGLLFGGLPFKVVRAGFKRKFSWIISSILLDELTQVLGSNKFGLQQSDIDVLLDPILMAAELVVPLNEINVITRSPGDNRVLECAVESKCQFIVTGDRRDLLSLQSFRGIQITTVRDFLKILA